MTLINIQEKIKEPVINCVIDATYLAVRNDLREYTFKQVSANAHYNKTGYRYPLFDFHKITIPIENIILHSIKDYDFSKAY